MTTLNSALNSGRIEGWQLNLGDIFNIANALLQRGLRDIEQASVEETLACSAANPYFSSQTRANAKNFRTFLDEFSKKPFRIALRKHVREGGILSAFGELPTLDFSKLADKDNRYAKTFELLIAYLCVTELGAVSSGFGMKIGDAPEGGDFDCLASFRDMLVYFEVKSGEKLKREHIKNFVARHSFLHPDLSILLVDFEGIDEKMVTQAYGLTIYEDCKIDEVRRLERNGCVFYTIESNVFILDIHKSGDVLPNIREALRYFWGYKALSDRQDYHLADVAQLGFLVKRLESNPPQA